VGIDSTVAVSYQSQLPVRESPETHLMQRFSCRCDGATTAINFDTLWRMTRHGALIAPSGLRASKNRANQLLARCRKSDQPKHFLSYVLPASVVRNTTCRYIAILRFFRFFCPVGDSLHRWTQNLAWKSFTPDRRTVNHLGDCCSKDVRQCMRWSIPWPQDAERVQ